MRYEGIFEPYHGKMALQCFVLFSKIDLMIHLIVKTWIFTIDQARKNTGSLANGIKSAQIYRAGQK